MAKTILLIDDEDLVVRSVAKLLQKQGYEVVICRNGQEALDQAKTTVIDLIVSDIRMPGMSGVDAIKGIREIFKSRGLGPIPEILITGYAEDSVNQEAELLHVAEYIYKPFDIRFFLEAIERNIK